MANFRQKSKEYLILMEFLFFMNGNDYFEMHRKFQVHSIVLQKEQNQKSSGDNHIHSPQFAKMARKYCASPRHEKKGGGGWDAHLVYAQAAHNFNNEAVKI